MTMKKAFTALIVLAAALSVSSAYAVTFPHKDHVDDYAGGDCFACHSPSDKKITPDLKKCGECHDKEFMAKVTFVGLRTHTVTWSLNHGPEARRDQDKCLVCHQEGKGPIGCVECHATLGPSAAGTTLKGMLNVHRGEFRITHPLTARTNEKLCASCHKPSFCTDCHAAYSPDKLANLSHRKSWSDKLTGRGPHSIETEAACADCHGPNVILPTKHEWTTSHAREARRNLASCQACHPDGDVCMKCHSAKSGIRRNPHPKGWGGTASSRLESASGGKTCEKCH